MAGNILDKARRLVKEASIPEKVADKAWHSYHKVGTGLGLASLGLSAASLIDSKRNSQADADRKKIEMKSLNALQRIHDALAIKTPDDSTLPNTLK